MRVFICCLAIIAVLAASTAIFSFYTEQKIEHLYSLIEKDDIAGFEHEWESTCKLLSLGVSGDLIFHCERYASLMKLHNKMQNMTFYSEAKQMLLSSLNHITDGESLSFWNLI